MRVARLGRGEAATALTGAVLSVTVDPGSCTELIRSWNSCLRWAVVGARAKMSSSSPLVT